MHPFRGRHFQRDIILGTVRWYCKILTLLILCMPVLGHACGVSFFSDLNLRGLELPDGISFILREFMRCIISSVFISVMILLLLPCC